MPGPRFLCSACDGWHDGPPLAWHFNAPEPWDALSLEEQPRRGELTSDQCVIDGEHFFVRGLIELPIVDGAEPFAWGVWVSLSKESFARCSARWHDPRRTQEPPYFGWLCNSLPGYPETLSFKASVHTRAVGMRPLIELEPTDHPLALEQRNGITMARVKEIAEQLLHG